MDSPHSDVSRHKGLWGGGIAPKILGVGAEGNSYGVT